jgi:putative Mg2+ transporter-C (MgtC) family protein
MLGHLEIVARLALAAVLGGVIGIERERLTWAAGLRTHMLVSVGACLIMIVSAFGFADVLGRDHVVLDPSRVAAQVVSGIGFLGAGTILLRGEVVRGLTTAASLWAVAAIGLAAGGGLYVAGVAATVIVLIILAGVKPIEERVRERMQSRSLRVVAERGTLSIDVVHAITGTRASRVRQFVVQQSGEDGMDAVTIAFVHLAQRAVDEIADKLRAHPGVVAVEAEER